MMEKKNSCLNFVIIFVKGEEFSRGIFLFFSQHISSSLTLFSCFCSISVQFEGENFRTRLPAQTDLVSHRRDAFRQKFFYSVQETAEFTPLHVCLNLVPQTPDPIFRWKFETSGNFHFAR